MKSVGCKYLLWLLLLPLAACNIHPFTALSTAHSLPSFEHAQPMNRTEFVHYLDSAAIDDWEGIWLMLGRDVYCYLAIERVNDFSYESRYTHRIRLWFDVDVLDMYTIPSGLVLGYIEQGLTSGVRRVTLYDISLWDKSLSEGVTTTANLSKDCSVIYFDNAPKKWRGVNQWGLKRIYPIRSHEEKEYRVRYL